MIEAPINPPHYSPPPYSLEIGEFFTHLQVQVLCERHGAPRMKRDHSNYQKDKE